MKCDHDNMYDSLIDEYDRVFVLCRACGKKFRVTEVYSRCCGYLRPTSQWNKGKKAEFEDRVTYKV